MKKFLILLISLCLTGCIVSNDDFSKTCTYVKKSENILDNNSINVIYDNKDVLKEAIVTKNYKSLNEEGKEILKDIKKSAVSFNEKYAFYKGIKITISKDNENEFELKYYLDVLSLDDDVLDEFMLKKNSVKFFNKMRNKNIECE